MSAGQSILLKSKQLRKALMLIGVYALHLVFFQALMQAAPAHSNNNTFKPLFTNHQKKQNNQPPNHPAVSYYTAMMKQGKDVGRAFGQVAPVVNQLDAVAPALPSTPSVIFRNYQASLTGLNLADDTFKRYRLIRVFLI